MMDDMRNEDDFHARLRAKYAELLPVLDERQARLVLGADAEMFTRDGQDGITIVANAANIDPTIVTAGVNEIRANRATN